VAGLKWNGVADFSGIYNIEMLKYSIKRKVSNFIQFRNNIFRKLLIRPAILLP